jgi:hypothetical protein
MRQLFDEDDGTRQLVTSQLVSAVRKQRSNGQLASRLQNHDGTAYLAPSVVRRRSPRFRDRLDLVDDILDFGRIDVSPPDNNMSFQRSTM